MTTMHGMREWIKRVWQRTNPWTAAAWAPLLAWLGFIAALAFGCVDDVVPASTDDVWRLADKATPHLPREGIAIIKAEAIRTLTDGVGHDADLLLYGDKAFHHVDSIASRMGSSSPLDSIPVSQRWTDDSLGSLAPRGRCLVWGSGGDPDNPNVYSWYAQFCPEVRMLYLSESGR